MKCSQINYTQLVLTRFGHAKWFGTNLNVVFAMLVRATQYLPQGLKDKAAVKFCNGRKSVIVNATNQILMKQKIKLKANDMFFSQEENQVKVQIDISEIDYEQIVIRFLPQIIDVIPKIDSTEPFIDALDLLKEEREDIVKALLGGLSNEKKEKLVKLFTNSYQKEICTFINKLINENGVKAEISELIVL